MVRQWQEFFYDKRYAATPMLSPDFVKLAEAYGIAGLPGRPARADVVPTRGEGPRARRARRSSSSRSSTRTRSTRWCPAGSDLHDMIRRPSNGKEAGR